MNGNTRYYQTSCIIHDLIYRGINMIKLLTFIFCGYLFIIPWDTFLQIQFGIPVSPSYIFLTLGFLFSLFTRRVSDVVIPRFFWPLMLLAFYMTVTVFWTSEPNAGLNSVINTWMHIFILLYIYNLIKTNKIKVKNFIISYILGVLTFGIYSFINIGLTGDRFSIVEDLNPSWYAAYLGIGIIVSVSVYSSMKKAGRIFIVINSIVMLLFLFLTQGRNTILSVSLALIVAFIFILIHFRNNRVLPIENIRPKALIKIIIVIVTVFSVTGTVLYQTGTFETLTRIASLTELVSGDRDTATAGRTTIWENYMGLIPSYAAIGSGVRSSGTIYSTIYYHDPPPHNVYILILLEFGVVGFVIWCLFIIGLIRGSIKSQRIVFSTIWLSVSLGLLGFGNDVLYYKYWWIGVLLLLLLYIMFEREGKNNIKNNKTSITD